MINDDQVRQMLMHFSSIHNLNQNEHFLPGAQTHTKKTNCFTNEPNPSFLILTEPFVCFSATLNPQSNCLMQ